MKHDLDDHVKWTMVAGGAAALAGFLARKGLEGGWKRYWGADPPVNPADPRVTWRDAIIWAGASASVMALARLLALRGSAAGWHAVKGRNPPL